MKYWLNPLLRKEMWISVRSWRFLCAIIFYNLFLAGIALFGFEMIFNVHWNHLVDYSGVVYVYLILAGIDTGMVMLLVPFYAAGSITVEKEKQTLEVLLATVMSPRQIIAGKLASAVSVVTLFVAASLPVLSIVFTVGGVQRSHLLQFLAVIIVEAVFLGSIGVFVSALLRRTTHVTIMSYIVSLGLCFGTLAFVVAVYLVRQLYYWNILQGQGSLPDVAWAAWVLLLNPVMTMANLLGGQTGYTREFQNWGEQLGSMPPFLVQNWCGVSLMLQILLTLLFLKLAERTLQSGWCRAGRKR